MILCACLLPSALCLGSVLSVRSANTTGKRRAILPLFLPNLFHSSDSSAAGGQIIDYQKIGLFFSYDLLGYGFMALSTFFAGLTMKAKKAGQMVKVPFNDSWSVFYRLPGDPRCLASFRPI